MNDTPNDDTPTWDVSEIFPDDPAALFEQVQGQLRDPHAILANALYRVHQADAVLSTIDAGQVDYDRYEHAALIGDTGRILTGIAEVAAKLLDGTYTQDVTDEEQAARRAADGPKLAAVKPQPVMGMRFFAELRGHDMGTLCGTRWLHVPGHGYIDISGTEEMTRGGGDDWFEFHGRVVSATPDHILGVTDHGISIALPRALVTETPDE